MKRLQRSDVTSPRFAFILVPCLMLLTAVSGAYGEEFTSINGEITVSDLGNWKVKKNELTERTNGVLTQFSNDSNFENSIRIETYDVNSFNVFDPAILEKFLEGIRKSGGGINTVKPIEMGGRRYQGIFITRLDQSGEKPLLIFVEQLILVDENRFHNITIASDRDQTETNPEIVFFFKHLKIK